MLLILLIIVLFGVYASAFIGSGVYIKTVCRMKTEKKSVTLTFDDGPDPKQTPQILDILRENNVKAIFFCIGSRAEANPDIVRRIASEGHTIGNHSYSHSPFFPLFGRKKMMEDLKRCEEVLFNITGERPTLFRPPFGVTNPTIAYAVRKLGYKTIGWSIRSLDTMKIDATERVTKRLHNGAIILLHDNLTGSELLLREIITQLKKRDYEIEK
ncbi:MAG: polysaccharide deacetylase family protein [Rikenellaceae bacterium]